MSLPEPLTSEACVDIVERCFAGYTQNVLQDIFTNIMIAPGAWAKLGTCIGFLRQVQNPELQAAWSKSLMQSLGFLDLSHEYMEIDVPVCIVPNDGEWRCHHRVLPKRLSFLYDDGTPLGFSFSVGMLAEEPSQSNDRRLLAECRRWSKTGPSVAQYQYDYNGGLLYHGPGGGEVFAVELTPSQAKPWSIHT